MRAVASYQGPLGPAYERELARMTREALDTSPCATCAFVDPAAMVADARIPLKLIQAFRKHEPFLCHRVMRTDAAGSYRPTTTRDGQVDWSRTSLCAGFVRLAQQHEGDADGFATAVHHARRKLLERLVRDGTRDRRIRRLLRDVGTDVAGLERALDVVARMRVCRA